MGNKTRQAIHLSEPINERIELATAAHRSCCEHLYLKEQGELFCFPTLLCQFQYVKNLGSQNIQYSYVKYV